MTLSVKSCARSSIAMTMSMRAPFRNGGVAMPERAFILLLVTLASLSVLYLVGEQLDCQDAHGVLARSAWGGVECVQVAK
jgi:hypothetical protein